MSELHIRTALGFIEVVGLAAAVAAADAALKAANVSLVGREISKGYGYVTVKIAGDVGAVKAALAAAKAVSEKVSKVWSVDVIPRPASAIGPVLTFNRETQGASEWVAAHGPRETFSTAPEKEEKKKALSFPRLRPKNGPPSQRPKRPFRLHRETGKDFRNGRRSWSRNSNLPPLRRRRRKARVGTDRTTRARNRTLPLSHMGKTRLRFPRHR